MGQVALNSLIVPGIVEDVDPHPPALRTKRTHRWATVGESELGTEAPFVSDSYLIRAMPVDTATMTTELPPTYVDWPADASVRLADAAECAELPAAEGDPLFADATQLTFFTDAGVTYTVAATPRPPRKRSSASESPCERLATMVSPSAGVGRTAIGRWEPSRHSQALPRPAPA